MRSIKMFGLTTVAAIAAMAFVGASAATAEHTALCTIDVALCSGANLVNHVHYTDKELTLKTTTPNLTIKCPHLFLGEILFVLGNPLIWHGTLTFPGACKPAGCEAKEVSASSTYQLLKEGTELGKITIKGETLVKCGEVLHCVYNGEGLVAHVLGPLVTGDNGHITITEQSVKKVSGTLCPASAKLTLLDIASPSPIYISS